MASPNTVIAQLTAPPLAQLLHEFGRTNARSSAKGQKFSITSGVRPVDLYCYLTARFGSPNGIQNTLKSDDSDNLVHWNYTLEFKGSRIDIMALNYRIDVFAGAEVCSIIPSADAFVEALKRDFQNHGPGMGKVRHSLERWHHFLNPYARLSVTVNRMFERAKERLAIVPTRLPHPKSQLEVETFKTNFALWTDAHSEANGLCQSVRMLAPVVAESFINLLLFIMLKPDLKTDAANYAALARQHINERVQNLHLNCSHFLRAVDWESQECKEFNSLMNRRNDYLHGNILPVQTSHEILFFDGKTPLFSDWRDFYDRCFGPYIHGFSVTGAETDLVTIEGFRSYVMSCIDPDVVPDLTLFIDTIEVGYNEKTGRMGRLLSEWTFDFFADLTAPIDTSYDNYGAVI